MKAARKTSSKNSKDPSASYNTVKEFNGKRYTGMKVGRTHHWYYDKGDWKEKKVTPDQWEITYSTIKRRAGKAPEGSGAPIGTAHHWFILAHQFVEKISANDYTTQLVGLKYKLAHRRADKASWNASGNAQRKLLVDILKNLISELEREPEQLLPIPLSLDYKNKHYEGTAVPILTACNGGSCQHLDVTLNKEHIGVMRLENGKWKMSEMESKGLLNAIGAQVVEWYNK